MANVPVEVQKTSSALVSDPWRAFRTDLDRLFDRFTDKVGFPSFPRLFSGQWSSPGDLSASIAVPAVDVTEADGAYKVTAELPGLSEKDIEVSVSGDMLVLRGEKRQEKEEKEANYYLSERAYGSFQRSFALPDGVDRDKISAEFNKGILTLTLPKTAEAKQQDKKIEIKAG
jgi:HSP20 family protein